MDIFEYLYTSISELPLMISGVGMALCAIFALRAFGFFMSLRWIRAATNLVYVVVVLLFLAKYGDRVAGFIQDYQDPPQSTEQQN